MRGFRLPLLLLSLTICATWTTSCSLFTHVETREVRVLVDKPIKCHLEPKPLLLPFRDGLFNPGTNGCPLRLTLEPNGGCLADWAAKNLVLNYEHMLEWINDSWKDCNDELDAGVELDGGVR